VGFERRVFGVGDERGSTKARRRNILYPSPASETRLLGANLLLWCATASSLVALVLLPAAANQTEVDLELVLAVDNSDSMTQAELTLQRQGYVAALLHPEIAEAVRAGARGTIALTYVEWAAPGRQRVVVPWTLIDGSASAQSFARLLLSRPEASLDGTSISAALTFSALLIESNGFVADRRVIDISGDGPNNMGPLIVPVRNRLVQRGITINGLPITLHRGAFQIPEIADYYRDCVIGGPDAFLIRAVGTASFEEAIRRKLTTEIAGRTPTMRFAAVGGPAPASDCQIGEKLGGGAR
jgi:hypothetical protein